ncbi:hypothetical protein N8I77_002897 [Diaporthe amygdali]|uniref:Uncharacterized protein n=1 Tax=Phomopsis amygdali TaxID=1214568 RepID=A0AAD9W563_PHOAM|nr:hypothetical protein N8I77_002897 [Diaporthe amygdali]
MSQPQESQEHQMQAKTLGRFSCFQVLPSELQLMVFEEVVLATLKPRVVLLDVEARSSFHPDFHLICWQITVENRQQLHEENPSVVAHKIMGISSAGGYTGTRFLNTLNVIDPPRYCSALFGLGVSLAWDLFWLPDNLEQFMATRQYPALLRGPTDEDEINFIMMSLHVFEEAVRWAGRRWEQHEELNENTQRRQFLLNEVFECFPSSWELVIMVNVPRGHISWDEVQLTGINDPEILTMGDREDGPDRCHSVYQTYEMLHDGLMEVYASQLNEGNEDLLFRDGLERAWPQLSFAFRKSAYRRDSGPMTTGPVGSGSRKRSRDVDDIEVEERAAKRREK